MTGTGFAYSDSANYYDLEEREGYWISGIKKNQQNRHWAGGGKIMIDRNIVNEYLKFVDSVHLDTNTFELVDIKPTNKQKFKEIENKNIE